jgi:hypothetical protein
MTRYKRRATRNETMQELIAEVRALRADVAMLRAERVQVVPMPYPQPYPVYPHPVQPYRPWNPSLWTSTIIGSAQGLTNVLSSTSTDLTFGSGASDATTVIAYNAGD